MNFSSVDSILQKEYSLLKSLLTNPTLNHKNENDRKVLEDILKLLDSQQKPLIEVARKRNKFLTILTSVLIEGNVNISTHDGYSKFYDANFSVTNTKLPPFQEIVDLYKEESKRDISTIKCTTHFDSKQMDETATTLLSLALHRDTDTPWQDEE